MKAFLGTQDTSGDTFRLLIRVDDVIRALSYSPFNQAQMLPQKQLQLAAAMPEDWRVDASNEQPAAAKRD